MHVKVIVLQFLLFLFAICYTINVYNQVNIHSKCILAKGDDSKKDTATKDGQLGEKEAEFGEKELEKTSFKCLDHSNKIFKGNSLNNLVLHQLNLHPEWFYNSLPPNGIDVPPDNFM